MPERPQVGLRLEPHMIPALRAAFDEAVETLTSQLKSFRQDGYIEKPWMGDPVSSMVLSPYNANFAGSPTSAYECLTAYQDELTKVRDTLSQMEDAYRRTEGDDAALWGRIA